MSVVVDRSTILAVGTVQILRAIDVSDSVPGDDANATPPAQPDNATVETQPESFVDANRNPALLDTEQRADFSLGRHHRDDRVRNTETK